MVIFKVRPLNKNIFMCLYEEQKFETYKAMGLFHTIAVPGLSMCLFTRAYIYSSFTLIHIS